MPAWSGDEVFVDATPQALGDLEADVFILALPNGLSDQYIPMIDAQAVGDHGIGFAGNRVTNKAEFDRVLRSWADTLRKHLDSVKVVAAATDK